MFLKIACKSVVTREKKIAGFLFSNSEAIASNSVGKKYR